MREFQIQKNEAGQRLDKYLKKHLCSAPANFIYKMLRKKNIVLNEKKASGSEKLRIGDMVKIYFSEETYEKFTAPVSGLMLEQQLPEISLDALPFAVLFEDDDILVINKPAGMLSQKASAEDVSANEYIVSYLLASGKLQKEELKTFRPSVCNRLDRNTSGVLIAGKTLKGLQEVAEGLKKRTIRKYYRCMAEGQMTEPCRISGYLRKDEEKNQVYISDEPCTKEDKKIETQYTPIESFSDAAYLDVELITGRTHQIRAHLASIGHPDIRHLKNGAKKQKGGGRLLLHAHRICFADGQEITAPLPHVFEKALKEWREQKKE